MAHTLKFKPSHLDAIHQRSIMASLTHRLNIARTACNTQLIERLEQERQQLTAHARDQGIEQFAAFCDKAIQEVTHIFWGGSTPRATEFNCGSDHWWYAFDPSTGEFLYADSEVELQKQIQNHTF